MACIYGTEGKCQGMLTPERINFPKNVFDRAKHSGIHDKIQPPPKLVPEFGGAPPGHEALSFVSCDTLGEHVMDASDQGTPIPCNCNAIMEKVVDAAMLAWLPFNAQQRFPARRKCTARASRSLRSHT
eukprot:1153724-Pelagomonas_calceolata.AAC.9